MQSNITNKNPFIINEPVIPPIFSSREKEEQIISNALFEQNENVVIYGNDAIGKSSIISTIYKKQIESTNSNIFPVRINSFDFVNAVETNFLEIIIHQICTAIWIKLMNKKYSELYSFQNSFIDILNYEEQALIKIFNIVSSEKISFSTKHSDEIGGKFFIEGKLSSGIENIRNRKPLAPFEFLLLLDEIIDILKIYDYNSILILCDELNHYPQKVFNDILKKHFTIFNQKKINFFIVVVNPEKNQLEDAKSLIEIFNYKLEVKPFQNIDSIKKLIENAYSSVNMENLFIEEMYFTLLNRTMGHPWWIQKICHNLYNISNLSDNKISVENLEKSAKKFEQEIEIYYNKIQNGLPFRKYHLINNL